MCSMSIVQIKLRDIEDRKHTYVTGKPNKNETLEITVRNSFSLFYYIHGSLQLKHLFYF